MATPEPAGAPTPAEIQRRVLAYWVESGARARGLSGPEDGPVFRFSEGPPTANGRPGIHHAVARTLKDLQLRYRRMTGHRIVTTRAGWDCHGLPVELEIERRLGLHSKKEIEAYGVDRFCEACRASVFESVDAWRTMSEALGFWLDYDRAYATMHPTYIESVWWSLKALFDRHLLEPGYYSLPYCPRCETPLSSHEVAQGYHETTDPSVTVRLRVPGPAGAPPRYLLVWTTTPWTLPANLLVAARADLEYVAVRAPDGAEHLLAASAVERYQPGAEVVGRWSGTELLGLSYEPLFPFAGPGPGRYRVVLDPMVESTGGTGFVHIAPSFGPDDFRLGEREGVGVFDPLDSRARFTDAVPPVAGQAFKAADPHLLDDLAARGLVVDRTTIRHTYPFCWRCGSALIYRALDAWFVRTSRFNAALRANNATVTWVPAHLRDGRFGNFLTEAKDWALSRNRYWGTPLPIWRCQADHVTCVGSFAELARLQGAPLPEGFDPHRVGVDPIRFPCPQCGAPATREPYTIDGWYDSGAAPFAQHHYPFEPGPFVPDEPLDYVAEGLDQTRGWFYTLLVLATALFERPAYRVCVVNGLVLDESGAKMSKSRGNIIEPLALLERHGGDAVRWAFLTVDFTEPLRVGEELVRQAGARTFGTLMHVATFYGDNARASRIAPTTAVPAPTGLLDRWLLSRLDATIGVVTASLDGYDPRPGALALRTLVDDLSTWYLRRSRERFWSEEASDDRAAAYATLSFTLATMARLFAPYAPFTAEYLHHDLQGTGLEGGDASVHLTRWPGPIGRRDAAIEASMDRVRSAVEIGREMRQRAQVKSRVPLPTFVRFGVAGGADDVDAGEAERILLDELNVREFVRAPDRAADDYPDAEWVRRDEPSGGGWALARRPTPELLAEGRVRESLRRLQALRKELGLRYTDRVDVTIAATGELRPTLEAARDRLARDLLADHVEFEDPPPADAAGWHRWPLDGGELSARMARAAG